MQPGHRAGLESLAPALRRHSESFASTDRRPICDPGRRPPTPPASTSRTRSLVRGENKSWPASSAARIDDPHGPRPRAPVEWNTRQRPLKQTTLQQQKYVVRNTPELLLFSLMNA